jgi:hypothetical protein
VDVTAQGIIRRPVNAGIPLDPRAIYVGFVVEKVAMGFFFRVTYSPIVKPKYKYSN